MRFQSAALVSFTALLATVQATGLNQYKQRSLVDVCANVNAQLNIGGIVFGTIQICLCISTLPQLLQTHPVLKAAVLRLGAASVTAQMNNLVRITVPNENSPPQLYNFRLQVLLITSNANIRTTVSHSAAPTRARSPAPMASSPPQSSTQLPAFALPPSQSVTEFAESSLPALLRRQNVMLSGVIVNVNMGSALAASWAPPSLTMNVLMLEMIYGAVS